MRRVISVLVTATLVGSLALTIGPLAPAGSSPVATEDSTYTTFGRVFPDPHGCDPGGSPFAKGNVCATDFLQISEVEDGFTYLEGMFPDYVEFLTLSEDFNGATPSGTEGSTSTASSSTAPSRSR